MAPLVYYAEAPVDSLGSGQGSLSSISGSTGALTLTCSPDPTACGRTFLTVHGQPIALAKDGTAAVLEEDTDDDTTTATGICIKRVYSGQRMGSACSSWLTNLITPPAAGGLNGLSIGRGNQAYFSLKNTAREVGIYTTSIAASAIGCNGSPIVTDRSGIDALACGGQLLLWNDGVFSSVWTAGFAAPLLTGAGLLVANVSGSAQPFSLSNGSAAGSPAGSVTPWAIDSSVQPLIYLSSGSIITARPLTGSGIGAVAADKSFWFAYGASAHRTFNGCC